MATLLSDEVFHDVAYKAKNRNHLLAGIDEFLDAVTILPPGEWDPAIRYVKLIMIIVVDDVIDYVKNELVRL